MDKTGETYPKNSDKKNSTNIGNKDTTPLNKIPLLEEDAELKERLDICIDMAINITDKATVTITLQTKVLDSILHKLCEATASMASIPKLLRFL